MIQLNIKKVNNIFQKIKKKLSGNTESSVDELTKLFSEVNSTTETFESQDDIFEDVISKQDSLKGRHFAFVVYPESAPET